MKKILFLISACLFLCQPGKLFGQGSSACSTANVFCTGANYYFPNATNSPPLGSSGPFGCLFSTPNPFWYYMQISQAGDINITLNQTDLNGNGLDVDFVLWGPFTSLADACANYNAGNIVDCSYSGSHTEFINIYGALPGQVYLLLMTNFSGQPGYMTFSSDPTSTGATGGANQLSVSSNLPVCPGGTVTLTASGGVQGNYTWTSPTSQTWITDTLTLTNLQPSDYGTYIVTSGNGICTNMGSVIVNGSQPPVASTSGPVCPGGTIALTAGNAYPSYSWTGPNGFTSTAQNPVITNADTTHAGLYTVYGQLGNCSSPPAVVQVSVVSSLSVAAANNGPLNQGATLFLSAAGSAGSYSWTGPNGFAQTGQNPYIQNVAPAHAGDYTVTVESAGCVSASAHTTVAITPLNEVSGVVYNDSNNNGTQDAAEALLPGVLVVLQPGGYVAFTNSQGQYSAFVPDTAYTVSLGGLSPYQVSNPASHGVTLTGGSQVLGGNNFGLYSPSVNDLKVTVTEVWTAAPGFPTYHRITYRNLGTSPMNGTVRFKPDPLLVPNANTSPGYTLAGDTLVWSFINLLPNQTAYKYVYMTVPVGTPLGTLLYSAAQVTPFTADADTLNNTFVLEQTVNGSWDPNDKAVQPAGPITVQDIAAGQDLVYTIRLQNTGTAPAVNVLVVDTLSGNLDLSSFQMLSSSHDYNLTMHENGILEWRFPNIMLPDSNANEPASHGDIQYRVKPKSTLGAGAVIENTAHIFFDFNEAVVTNTTHTPVGVVATEEEMEMALLNVFPNPTSGSFTWQLSNSRHGQVKVRVMNMLGQVVFEQTAEAAAGRFTQTLELANAPTGIYLLQVIQNGNSFTKQVVLLR